MAHVYTSGNMLICLLKRTNFYTVTSNLIVSLHGLLSKNFTREIMMYDIVTLKPVDFARQRAS